MNSIDKLIKIIESINLEITDNNITDLQNELSKLETLHGTNKIVIYFLKMLGALAKYLDSKRSGVQADTIPVLNSIVAGLAKLLDSSDLTENENQKILSENILKFKSLKNKISSIPEISDNDIDELKAVILAVDWEISDTTLENFETVITALLSRLKYYKIHDAFLKIIHSIVRYIGTQKANAHTDSISFLHSVFKNFELMVQTPGMAYKDKRELLETDIKRFQDFKHKITLEKPLAQPPDQSPDQTSDQTSDQGPAQTIDETPEDESFTPALSQFKQADMADDDTSLTTLSQTDESPVPLAQVTTDTMEPSSAGSENIMDDLFNAKESPADELLDAIHLLNVHGENPDQEMDMLDKNEESEGIKKFTPQTKTNDPIPEIQDRLDAFFNLDPPGVTAVQEETLVEPGQPGEPSEPDDPDKTDDMVQEVAQAVEIDTYGPDDATNGIIPFDEKDESFEEVAKQYDDNLKTILDLHTLFKNPDCLKDESSLSSIKQSIEHLKEQWQDDPEKTALLQIISMKLPQNDDGSTEENNNQTDKNLEKESGSEQQAETPGIWHKIKKSFKS